MKGSSTVNDSSGFGTLGNFRVEGVSLSDDRVPEARKEVSMKRMLQTIGALAALCQRWPHRRDRGEPLGGPARHRRDLRLRTRQGHRRRARPDPLPVREGQARQEFVHRSLRHRMAAADRIGQATRVGRSKGLTARNHKARRRTPAGHLQPPPALHIHQGHQEGPDERPEPRRLRRRMVRRVVRRRQGREECDQRDRRQRSGANRLRVLADTGAEEEDRSREQSLLLADQHRALQSRRRG